MNKKAIFFLIISFTFLSASALLAQDGFTQKDRELLIELKVKMGKIDKRFEQVDKRFEQMMDFLKILSAIFTSLVIAVIGFAYWDRRTIIKNVQTC